VPEPSEVVRIFERPGALCPGLYGGGQPAHRRCCSRCCFAPMAECPGVQAT